MKREGCMVEKTRAIERTREGENEQEREGDDVEDEPRLWMVVDVVHGGGGDVRLREK